MGVVQVIIDRTTPQIIQGTYEFERAEGGIPVAPSGSAFPSVAQAGEWFWLTTNQTLYRRSDDNTSWDQVQGNPDPVATPFSFAATCQTSDAVGNCVYVSGNSLNGVPQVTSSNPLEPTTMPAIGLIMSKASATSCIVAYFGAYLMSGLVPNATYVVGIGGAVSSTVPVDRPFIRQVVGQALDSNRLLLNPSKTLLRLNS